MTVPERPPAPPPQPPSRAGGEPAHDPWLQQALRHAPDAELQPPAALRDAILRDAAQALDRPSVARASPAADASAARPEAKHGVAARVAAVQLLWRGFGQPAWRWAGAAALVLLVVWAGWPGSSPMPSEQLAMQASRAPETPRAESRAAEPAAAGKPDAASEAPDTAAASVARGRPDPAVTASGDRARREPGPQSPLRVAATPSRSPAAPAPAGRSAAASADPAAGERAVAADTRPDAASGVAVAIAPAGSAAPAPAGARAVAPGVTASDSPVVSAAAAPPEAVAVLPRVAPHADDSPSPSPARRPAELSGPPAAAAADAGSAGPRARAAAPQVPALVPNALDAAARPRALRPDPATALRRWARDPQLQWRTRGGPAAAGPAQRAWLERLAAAGGHHGQAQPSASAADADSVELWLMPGEATPVSIHLDAASARVTLRQGAWLWSTDLPRPELAALLEAVRGWSADACGAAAATAVPAASAASPACGQRP